MLVIRLILDQEKISSVLGNDKHVDGVVFGAWENDVLKGYGIFQAEDDILYVYSCHAEDKDIVDGIIKAAVNWADTISVESYDLSEADDKTYNDLIALGYKDKDTLDNVPSKCETL